MSAWFAEVRGRTAVVVVSLLLGCAGSGESPPPGGDPQPVPPTVMLTASPESVASGEVSTLTWSSTEATSCTASGGWSGARAISGAESTGALASTTTYTVTADGAGGSASASVTVTVVPPPPPPPPPGQKFGLEWHGDGATRRMLYWHNPFPIYDATYVFRVYPRKKTVPPHQTGYYTTFFWGNDGTCTWDNDFCNTYYGAHPYPVPPPNGPGQWEITVFANDHATGFEVEWDRWYTQAFRAWRESARITQHEFYWDLPDTSKVIRVTVDHPDWADKNPPIPAIVMGQTPDRGGVSWGGYPGWEEFNGIIRGIQFYSNDLSVQDILSEIDAPKSTSAGLASIWYLNLDPRPTDVTDKKGVGTPHDGSWDGGTAFEWTE